jgi:hypothetical protein
VSDYDDLDHGDRAGEAPLSEEEQALFPLFADALDPDTSTTVGQRAAEWRELFG